MFTMGIILGFFVGLFMASIISRKERTKDLKRIESLRYILRAK